MSKKFILLVPLAMFAADPAGFTLWKSAELKGYEKKLSPKIDAQKVASQTLAQYGSHLTMIAHREGSGEAELHRKMADLFVIESGAATLVVGGRIPKERTTGPGEVRGPSIEGGARHPMAAGDVAHIPANTPHQLLLDPGQQVTYFVVKVETK
jgi:mannose-6-phosphate isomerase-like protein (cupin superfamily)